ncbi:serine carboxypeptidase-like 18 isoform X2 [Quercus robur]|uniref:serine carboxypeptidase-like 18 isoform X2 n=1 Tax=Quercus robur TaxID=38942 RepID=UPI002161F88E|nr:serine carboxypeptidase-like 18 isoform X2 [Quercus robur]
MSSKSSSVCLYLLLLLLVSGTRTAVSHWIVKTLPGFPGELPFKLETGYISVGEVEFFYYFVESEGNPGADPLLLYFNGGPGCSALNGFLYQIGPLKFNITDYTGGLPTLIYEPNTWTKTANVLFLDAPVGAGFSYATISEAWSASDTKVAAQAYEFLRNWLIEHSNFVNNMVYLGSDSYQGLVTPILAQDIINGNEAGIEPQVNIKGLSLGCPHTNSDLEDNTIVTFAHRMALISDAMYKSAKTSCNGNYIDSTNPKCTEAVASISQNFDYILFDIWINYKSVQDALHVRPGTVKEVFRCNITLKSEYSYNVKDAFPYYKNLTSSGLQILVFSGDHDMTVTHIAAEQWINSLDLTIDTEWRPWFVDGQVAGYTRRYTNSGYRLTYATIKGAGHSPTEYKRKECYDMFHRWIHYYPL